MAGGNQSEAEHRAEQSPAGAMTTKDAEKASPEEVLRRLGSNEKGLDPADAKNRLAQYGYNEIVEKKVNPFLKFLRYFWGPIPWMIEIAAILSIAIGHIPDFVIIVVLLMLNATIGFLQEHKADNAIELLKKKLALKARVLRAGKWSIIEARELVPGDIVRSRLGEVAPADIKLLKGQYLQVDQSALTGESLPVEKKVGDVLYSGSTIRQGEMDGVVVTTGMSTYFGTTAKLVEEARKVSHFTKTVTKIGDYLILMDGILVTLIFIVAAVRPPFDLLVTLQFALILTIAAVPVALPAVLSVTMAVGAIELARREAIVSKLVAIEEMAGVDVLCADKTGTITENKLTVGEVQSLGDFKPEDVLLYAALASREEDQDPIDDAILVEAKKHEKTQDAAKQYTVKDFKPFDPVVKRTEATVVGPKGKELKVAKGAPQIINKLATGKEEFTPEIDKIVVDFAKNGYRALGAARTDSSGKWQYVGLIPLFDPPREDSAETIKTSASLGVKVKMVTGDHVAIAKRMASQVGLGQNIQLSTAFVEKPERIAKRVVEEADGFAEVFPEHKFEIVQLLQSSRHIVGMTGDGVNDAPALKQADAGIAVTGATDAAKSAADIVLTKPGLSVIIDAIKTSRRIFQRMNSYAIYRIAETVRVLFFVTLVILAFNFYPITAIMIVLLALFNDAPIMMIAYDKAVARPKPERWNMRVVLGLASFLGIIGVIFSFAIYYIGKDYLHLGPEVLQTFIFLKLAVAGHLTIFLARVRGPFWSLAPSYQLFWGAVGTKLLATIVAVYGFGLIAPISWSQAGFIWAYALAAFVITDVIKVQLYKLLDLTGLRFRAGQKPSIDP